VAQSLTERTGKQCRERWHNHLGSGIKKGDWTEEVTSYLYLPPSGYKWIANCMLSFFVVKKEDKVIITAQRAIGNQWAKV
jgi:hypothetical protein